MRSGGWEIGAAMLLVYDSRRATRDIDAAFQSHGVVPEEAHAVAEEPGLPQLASVYIAQRGDSAASRVFDHPRSAGIGRLAGVPAGHEGVGAPGSASWTSVVGSWLTCSAAFK